MKVQLLEAIYISGENIDEKVTTPEYNHILIVDKQAQQLDKYKGKPFHLVVVKPLYIMIRERPHLETAISFLFIRVSNSNVGDCEKL